MQDTLQLNTVLGICIEMEKELRRILSRQLNGIKKVCCYDFFKISTLSTLLSPAAESGDRDAQCKLKEMLPKVERLTDIV
jgi:hypothetical protein